MIDNLLPDEMARMAERIGEKKAHMTAMRMFVLSVLAGSFIAFGAIFATTVTAGSTLPFGITKLVGGVVFSLGLILVIVGGAELFTGNNLIVMAWASKKGEHPVVIAELDDRICRKSGRKYVYGGDDPAFRIPSGRSWTNGGQHGFHCCSEVFT